MAISKADRLDAVHKRALKAFDQVQTAQRDERMQCREDRRFYSVVGAQWEGGLGDQFENKPRFEINKVHLAVIRIINEYRNNRISVDFTSKDGTPSDTLADTCDGLYRADEQASTAQEAYDNAFEESAGGGFGAWRLRAAYEDDDDDENDRQKVCIEPIYDADSSVFFDLDAKRQDKADAKRCWVLTGMTPEAYEEEYEDSPASWPKSLLDDYTFDWCTPEVVYVCEYYEVEEKTEVIHIFRGLDDQDMMVPAQELEDDETKRETLIATGFREVRQKRVKVRKVHKYILSGGKVLEDEGYIAGKCIPIIPVYGKRWVVDGIERCMGHVRLAKDAQRLLNMLMSWLAEIAARFDTEKPILSPQQIAGHTTMWSEDAISKYPYLLLNNETDQDGNKQPIQPLNYTRAPSVPPAMAALMQLAEQALQDLLGNQQAGEQIQPNLSGKAVELIQNRLDMQSFIYMSNFAKAMQRSGEVWLSMKKEITVEEARKMKVVDPNGSPSSVVVNEPSYDPETASTFLKNDLSEASFDVAVEVGPSSDSRRAATVRALTQMAAISADPETKAILEALSMMNMEGEGLKDVNSHFRRKLIRMGVVQPNEEETQQLAAEQQGKQPDPQSQYLIAAANEAEANAAQSRAKTVQTIADADLKRAQTAKTMGEAMNAQQQEQLASTQALQSMLDARNPAGNA